MADNFDNNQDPRKNPFLKDDDLDFVLDKEDSPQAVPAPEAPKRKKKKAKKGGKLLGCLLLILLLLAFLFGLISLGKYIKDKLGQYKDQPKQEQNTEAQNDKNNSFSLPAGHNKGSSIEINKDGISLNAQNNDSEQSTSIEINKNGIAINAGDRSDDIDSDEDNDSKSIASIAVIPTVKNAIDSTVSSLLGIQKDTNNIQSQLAGNLDYGLLQSLQGKVQDLQNKLELNDLGQDIGLLSKFRWLLNSEYCKINDRDKYISLWSADLEDALFDLDAQIDELLLDEGIIVTKQSCEQESNDNYYVSSASSPRVSYTSKAYKHKRYIHPDVVLDTDPNAFVQAKKAIYAGIREDLVNLKETPRQIVNQINDKCPAGYISDNETFCYAETTHAYGCREGYGLAEDGQCYPLRSDCCDSATSEICICN